MTAIPRLYAAIGAAVLIALFLGWVARIDHLRAHYKRELAAEKAASVLFAERVKSKSEEIVAKALANKSRVESSYATIERRDDNEIRRRIDAAVAAVRLRTGAAGTHPGSGGNSVPRAPIPAGSPAGADRTAVVDADDLEVCSENTVKAEGWQEWWRSVEAIPR